MAVQYNPAIVTDGLVLYLDAANRKSYPGTGTSWFDLSGNNNDFTLSGTLTFSSSSGFSNFSSTNKITRSNFPQNLSSNGFTSLCWARAVTQAGYQKLIGNGDVENYIDLYIGTTGKYRIEAGAAGFYNNNISVGIETLQADDGIWRMYGAYESTLPVTNPSVPFGIGNEGNTAFNYPWAGNIYSVMIYSRVLSSYEITQNFNALRGRFGI